MRRYTDTFLMKGACLIGIATGLFACETDRSESPALDAVPVIAVGNSADSATSMTYLLRRFQSRSPDRPATLAHAAASRDELARHFIDALRASDTLALARMRLSRSEFAHLFFPGSIFMAPPYELDPEVVWMQTDGASDKGLLRLMREFGGADLGYLRLECQPPQVHGEARLHGCDVLRLRAPADTVTERMFGAIMERSGQFKFFSFQNSL